MSHQHCVFFMWRWLLFNAFFVISFGNFGSANAQDVGALNMGISNPNPSSRLTYIPRKASENSPKEKKNTNNRTQPIVDALVDDKQRKIDDAIDEGNTAHDSFDYARAFASYKRVADELNPKDARAAYGLGNVYFDLSCTDGAIRAFTEALGLDKDFHDALIALGYAYAKKERYDEAEKQFRAVLKKTPDDADAKIGLAYNAAKKKQYEEAINQFNLIINNQSIESKKRAISYYWLGDVHMEQKKWDAAADDFKKAIELSPDLAVAYVRLGQTELFPATSRFSLLVQQERRIADRERLAKAAKKAVEYVRTAIDEHHYNHPFGNLFLANALMFQPNYQEALANIDEYLRKVKELEDHSSFLAGNCNLGFQQLYAYGHFYRALIYNQQALLEDNETKRNEFTEKVIEHARRLIQVKEDDPAGYVLLGQVYIRKERWREAIEQFEKSLLYEANETNKGSTYNLIGICYEKLDQDQDAIRAFNEALKRRPDDASTLFSLAGMQERQGNFDEAIRLKKEAIQHEPEPTASFYWILATSYLARARKNKNDADYEEAIKLLRKALDMNQSLGIAYLTLGNVYKFYKDGAYAEESLANYEQAEKYSPQDAAIKFLIGDLFYSVKKNNDAAINYLRQAIKIKPDYVQAYRELADVYHDKKEDDEAIRQLLTALKYDGKYLDAYLDLADLYDHQKNYDEAVKILTKAIDNLPKEYLPYKELARMYSYQQKNEQAIEYYQKAIGLMKPAEAWLRDVFQCRILRLRGQFSEAISCVQNVKMPSSGDPAQIPYEIGLTYVASKNKEAARAQYERLKQMRSSLAANLLRQIDEMK